MDEVVNTTLMELALKLSSLTDASIFLLVETQEGRRFAGKRHLCDAYSRNCLSPLASDVELEFDPTVSTLHHRQSPPTSSANAADYHFPSLYENHPPSSQHQQQQHQHPTRGGSAPKTPL